MITKRDLTQSIISEIEKQVSEEAFLTFLTIYHEDLHEPIRVVSDPENFILDGNEYVGFKFDINLLSDNDSPPKAKLSIANIDEQIGRAVLRSTSPVNLSMEVIPLSEFDMNTYPRTALNVDVIRAYRAPHLRLIDVTGDVMQVSGTIKSWDYSQEPWPALKATENRFPGLFWS